MDRFTGKHSRAHSDFSSEAFAGIVPLYLSQTLLSTIFQILGDPVLLFWLQLLITVQKETTYRQIYSLHGFADTSQNDVNVDSGPKLFVHQGIRPEVIHANGATRYVERASRATCCLAQQNKGDRAITKEEQFIQGSVHARQKAKPHRAAVPSIFSSSRDSGSGQIASDYTAGGEQGPAFTLHCNLTETLSYTD